MNSRSQRNHSGICPAGALSGLTLQKIVDNILQHILTPRTFRSDVRTRHRWDDPGRDTDIVGLFPNRDADPKTDEYTLLMTYGDDRRTRRYSGNAEFRLVTRDGKGKWVNAVDVNLGGSKKYARGPFEPGRYGPDSYGLDPDTKSVWAVINHSHNEFAVTRV